MHRISARHFVILALGVVQTLFPASGSAAAVSAEWAKKWKEDLQFVARELPEKHVNLFHTLTEDEWNSELSSLTGRLKTLDHHQIAV